MLPRTYCFEFVNWVASLGSTIHTNTVPLKLRNLNRLDHVRSHVFCPSNPEIHDSQHMHVSLLQHTHSHCFLSPLPDVALCHCQEAKLLSCLIAMQELRPLCICCATQTSGIRGIGHRVRQAARLGSGQRTWRNVRKAKLCQDPLHADASMSLRQALCADGTEAARGGAAPDSDALCTRAFAGTHRTIHFIGHVGKHPFVKAPVV